MAVPVGSEPTWRVLYGEEPMYVDPATRVYINHIPSCFSEPQLKQRLQATYGPVDIEVYLRGEYNDGYAWVAFRQEESVRRAIAFSSLGPAIKPVAAQPSAAAPPAAAPPAATPSEATPSAAAPPAAKPEAAKPEPAKHEVSKHEAAKHEVAKHEAAKHEAAAPEAAGATGVQEKPGRPAQHAAPQQQQRIPAAPAVGSSGAGNGSNKNSGKKGKSEGASGQGGSVQPGATQQGGGKKGEHQKGTENGGK